MATCPDGHQSVSEDYCDVCGMRIMLAPGAESFVAGFGFRWRPGWRQRWLGWRRRWLGFRRRW